MNEAGESIRRDLEAVDLERAKRKVDPALVDRVAALKTYQHERFRSTYADLLADPGHRSAATFFLEELYGPFDFTARDQQFARIVPALVRIFPDEVVGTVRALAELHRISEQMDTRMAGSLASSPPDRDTYRTAWQSVGRPELRRRQVELTIQVGRALERYTRRPLLRATLRAMRRPAQMAGLSALQRFLESGFDTFAQMAHSSKFLATIEAREEAFAAEMFGRPTQEIGAK